MLLKFVKPTISEQFCLDILNSDIKYAKVLVNVLLSLGSDTKAQSPVQLTSGALFSYGYSSLNDAIKYLSDPDDTEGILNLDELCTYLSHLSMPYYEAMIGRENPPSRRIYHLQTDVKPLKKPHSPTLSGRKYVYAPNNKVPGNKPIIPGYNYSYVNLGYKPPTLRGGSRWSLPYSSHRLGVQEDALQIGSEQIATIMTDEKLPFKKADLVINAADLAYSHPRFIVPCAKFKNLINILRLRHGSGVWAPAQKDPSKKERGAPRLYGDTFHLQTEREGTFYNPKTGLSEKVAQTPIFDRMAQEHTSFETTTTRGKKITIELWRWNDLLLRSQDGFVMKDKPFDLIAARVTVTLTGDKMFKNDLFAGVFGEKRAEVSLFDAYIAYRQRFDIEVHNRFSNQQLLLDKFQTPNVEHLDNWVACVLLTYWLLFFASDDVDNICNPWERYLPKFKQQNEPIKESDSEPQTPSPTNATNNTKPKKSVAQTKKAASGFFSTFDLKMFFPKVRNNGKGRTKGQKQTKRTRHPVRKKTPVDLNNRINV